MNRTLSKLALGVTLALLSLPSDVLAGRGGGYRGGGGGGGGYGGGTAAAARWAGYPWVTRQQ